MLSSFLPGIKRFVKNNHRFIQWTIAAVTVAYAGKLLLENVSGLHRLLNHSLWEIVTVICLFIIQFFLSAVTDWLIIQRTSGRMLPFFPWIRIMVIGRLINNLVAKGGSVYRAVILKSNFQISYTTYIHAYSFYTWLLTLLSLALVVILVLFSMPNLMINGVSVYLVSMALFLILLIAPIGAASLLKMYTPSQEWWLRIIVKIEGVFTAMMDIGRNYLLMVRLMALMLLKIGVTVLLFMLLFKGMDVHVTYAHLALLVAIQNISLQFSITPGNIGIRELIFGAICGAIGIGVSEGIMVSALLRVVAYVVIFPFGIFFGGLDIIRSGQLKKAS